MTKKITCRGLVISSKLNINDPWGTLIQFILYKSLVTGSSEIKRKIELGYDGRWEFNTYGDPLPFEQVDIYNARRKRDRFSPEIVEEYCLALGIRINDENFYGPKGYYLHEDTTMPPDYPQMTLEESQRILYPR